MPVDPPADSWKDDHRYADRGDRGDPVKGGKAANGLSSAKAGVPRVPVAGGDRFPDPRPSRSTPPRRGPRLELSLTQILGSTGAAVTAAFLGSRLGVAGTLIGAALASVISVVGGAFYTTSLKATRQRVTKLVGRTDDEATAGPGPLPDRPLPRPARPVVAPTDGGRSNPGPGIPGSRAAAAPGRPARRPRPVLRGAVAGVLLSAAVFSGALLVITGVESVTGSALSGGSAGSLTILGGDDAGRSDPGPGGTTSGSGTKPSPTSSTATSGSAAPSAAATTAASTPAPSGAGTQTTTAGPSTGTSTGGMSTGGMSTGGTSTGGTSTGGGPGAAPGPTGAPPGATTPGGTTPAGTSPTGTDAPTATSIPNTTAPATDASVGSPAHSTVNGASSTAAPTSGAGQPPR